MSKTQKKILVVDDSPISQEVTRKILETAHFIVFSAWEGEECLKMARSEKPDAILMDVILPDGDGKEFVRQLKKDALIQSIPIIFMTNTVKLDDDKGFEAIDIDGNLYRAFAKPLHHPKILSVIRKEINRSRSGGLLPKSIIQKV